MFRATGALLVVVGVLAVASYLLHLQLGIDVLSGASSFSYYMMSNFGALAIAWGAALWLCAETEAGRAALAIPSATGFLVLSAMRILNIPHRSDVFETIISETSATILVFAELVVFAALALGFWRARGTTAESS